MATAKLKIAKVLRPEHYKKMQWKNGKGTTAEIAICQSLHPSQSEFKWRLSTADITEDGDFSEFPGCDRYLTVTEGDGIRLGNDAPLKPGTVLRFSGEGPMSCQLLSGKVKDLGLIFRRDEVKAKFEIVPLGKKPRSFQLEGTTIFLFGLSAAPIKVTIYPGEQTLAISAGETIQIDFPSTVPVRSRLALLEPDTVASKPVEAQLVLIELETALV